MDFLHALVSHLLCKAECFFAWMYHHLAFLLLLSSALSGAWTGSSSTTSSLSSTTSSPPSSSSSSSPVTTFNSSSSSQSTTLSPVTTTALPAADTPPDHWTPDKPDPYVCEYLGENGCWSPSIVQEGPPYAGFDTPRASRNKTCVVRACGDPNGDDAPEILRAFWQCREDAHIVFENTTYYIASVMNTTGLRNVDVEIKGTLSWNNSNITYWLDNSLSVGFQNQSSAWYFGGDQVHFFGHGYGTLNGNGQAWYMYNNGRSNIAGRPHAITIADTSDSVIEGLNFINSQMWTMTVARSERILLQDIYVNNTCAPGTDFPKCTVNTDGADTVYANNITFLRWTIDNGDDSIALKQNSTNIYVADCTFYRGFGIAVGSIGQYPGQIEVIENLVARNLTLYNTANACFIKTWTGLHKGYPPNGGGGGIGHARNLTCVDLTMQNAVLAWMINQKTSYNGQLGGENTSLFQISDVFFGNSSGTTNSAEVAAFQCSGNRPCQNLTLFNNNFTVASSDEPADDFLCSNIGESSGFNCTGGCGPNAEGCPS